MLVPVVRKKDLLFEEISGECVIYDSGQKKAHHLNSTLTWIWQSCDGSTDIEAMAAAFERHFSVTNGLDIVLSGLEQLENRELLESPVLAEIAASERPTMTRRAVLAGGSVLMPAVISMVAPTAAAAKSKPEKDKDKDKDKEKD